MCHLEEERYWREVRRLREERRKLRRQRKAAGRLRSKKLLEQRKRQPQWGGWLFE